MSTTTQRTIEVASGIVTPVNPNTALEQPTQFKIGWSYDVFLRKNARVPSESAQDEWLAMSRQANKEHVNTLASLVQSGARAKCSVKARFNAKDGRFDTVLSVSVAKPGCNDTELIIKAVSESRARFTKTIENMTAAARGQGAIL